MSEKTDNKNAQKKATSHFKQKGEWHHLVSNKLITKLPLNIFLKYKNAF